ncbi:MAG TPA: Holliday junction resolvase RuvX [Steroidobacteraceae bacterium]|nr:Holliday junction resolvase RuvX [Steroidobacteraceae bacterium]
MTAPAARTVLSFDYGLRRIGVAVGNTLTGTAQGLATVAAQDGLPDWRAVDQLVADWRPQEFVVGVPYNMQGEDAGIAAAALRFAGELQDRYRIGVHRVDERLTSREAEDELRERRRSGAKARRVRRGDVDREAARLLLLQWLRARPGAAGP